MLLYRIGRFVFWVYFSIFYRVTVIGHENIPATGGLIICSNHIHWLDPMLLAISVKRVINYMAKVELFKNRLFSAVLKGVNAFPVKRGTADIASVKMSLKVIKEGKILGIFPEGTRSKDGNIKAAEPGVALISIKTSAPVIPVRIVGSYKLFGKLKVIIGKSIFFEEYYGKKLSGDEINVLSQSIMAEISKLA